VRTTYLGPTIPVTGVGLGVGAGVGVGVGVGSVGTLQGEVSCPVSDDDNGTWFGVAQTLCTGPDDVWAERKCMGNRLRNVNSNTFFTRISLPLQ